MLIFMTIKAALCGAVEGNLCQ